MFKTKSFPEKRAFSLALRGLALTAAFSALLGAAAQSARATDAATIEAAKKEGTVTWASGLIFNQAVRPLAAAFEKKYGIKVETTNTDKIVLRLINENRAGNPTIDFVDTAGAGIAALREADVLVPYQSSEIARYKPEHKDPEHYWASCCVFFYGIAVNTDLVKPADEPKSWDDLLEPKWKGKMVWQSDEGFSGPPNFIGMMLLTRGEKDSMAYLEKFAKQDVARVPGNARAALDQVILGQYPLAVIALNHHSVISGGQGAPVKWLKVSPMISTAEVQFIVKGAKHPNAAKLLYDFLLSPEGQNVLREANYLPADPNVASKVADLKPEGGGFTAVTLAPAMNQTHLPQWLDLYKKMFVK